MFKCPICLIESILLTKFKFPFLLCDSCTLRALDSDGNKVEYFNENIGGKLVSHHTMLDGTTNTDQNYNCNVDSKACSAVVFALGGTGLVMNTV